MKAVTSGTFQGQTFQARVTAGERTQRTVSIVPATSDTAAEPERYAVVLNIAVLVLLLAALAICLHQSNFPIILPVPVTN